MRKIIVFLFGLGLTFQALSTPLYHFNSLIIFGDSLSDSGNLYEYMLHALPKSPPYYQGRFSNGPIWVDHLASSYLGQGMRHDYQNYAVGGAGAILEKKENLPYTLAMEVSDYLYWHPRGDKKSSLYFIWIGANNYLKGPENVEKITDDVVKAIGDSMESLIQHGGNKFILANLPDLSTAPESRDHHNQSLLHKLTTRHNHKLKLKYEALKARHPDVRILYFDAYALFKEALDHPEKYHIKDTTNPCYLGGYTGLVTQPKGSELEALLADQQDPQYREHWQLIKDNPQLREVVEAEYLRNYLTNNGFEIPTHCEGYIFWDRVHPTTEVHQVIAEKVKTLLDAAGLYPSS